MPSSRAGMARGAASVTPGHSSTCATGTRRARPFERGLFLWHAVAATLSRDARQNAGDAASYVRTRIGTWGEKLTRFFGDGFGEDFGGVTSRTPGHTRRRRARASRAASVPATATAAPRSARPRGAAAAPTAAAAAARARRARSARGGSRARLGGGRRPDPGVRRPARGRVRRRRRRRELRLERWRSCASRVAFKALVASSLRRKAWTLRSPAVSAGGVALPRVFERRVVVLRRRGVVELGVAERRRRRRRRAAAAAALRGEAHFFASSISSRPRLASMGSLCDTRRGRLLVSYSR